MSIEMRKPRGVRTPGKQRKLQDYVPLSVDPRYGQRVAQMLSKVHMFEMGSPEFWYPARATADYYRYKYGMRALIEWEARHKITDYFDDKHSMIYTEMTQNIKQFNFLYEKYMSSVGVSEKLKGVVEKPEGYKYQGYNWYMAATEDPYYNIDV